MDSGAQTTKVKMSGYLQMKIKRRMMSSWKNYWFVLEDRLLLYYRSKVEYQAISPCKGSINLGPPCVVRSLPSINNAFQLETRTITYTLKAENSEEQKKWMQTILAALNQNQNFPLGSPKRLSHFRYSLDNLIPETEPNDTQVTSPLERQNTMPHRLKNKEPKSNEIIQRLQKMGAHSYGGSLSVITKIATKKVSSPTLPKNTYTASQGSLPDCRFNEHEDIIRPYKGGGDNIYERISGDSDYSNRASFLVDNENYSIPLRKSAGAIEAEVREKKTAVPARETKSLLMVENDQYASSTRQVQSDTVIYSEPKINELIDCNKNSVVVENSLYQGSSTTSGASIDNEHLYEDLDKFSHYSRLNLKDIDESSSQSSGESRSRSMKEKKSKPVVDKDHDKSLRKSKSFIRRMWKKKNKKEEKIPQENIYAEIGSIPNEKLEIDDGSAIQMLSELHNILENKKTKLKVPASKASNNAATKTETPPQATTCLPNSELCPALPPKTQKPSPDTKSNQPNEQVRSLDEILEDLDKEKLESKTKVQMLIEKFSEPESEDVVLRKHNKSDFKNYRHSDELNKLLDELVKVTSAPIMTPGVTSSLVNPNLSDEEWLKLLPVRQRRLSEPDYDVPRPHKSIQLPVEPEKSDVIPATRFFGPVLPSTIVDNCSSKEESLCTSMTPDSLEVEDKQKRQTQYSYTSHDYPLYHTDLQRFSQDYTQQDDKIIYALPKSYLSVATHIVNTCQNICSAQLSDECTIIYKNVKNVEIQEEIFNDSLELCNESSTEF